jgi:hypothetical protein
MQHEGFLRATIRPLDNGIGMILCHRGWLPRFTGAFLDHLEGGQGNLLRPILRGEGGTGPSHRGGKDHHRGGPCARRVQQRGVGILLLVSLSEIEAACDQGSWIDAPNVFSCSRINIPHFLQLNDMLGCLMNNMEKECPLTVVTVT